jgi:hypothetical protein
MYRLEERAGMGVRGQRDSIRHLQLGTGMIPYFPIGAYILCTQRQWDTIGL